jgi:hypothetical protein
MVHKHIWESQITSGSLVKPGSSGRFEISRTGVSPILKCLKNSFYKIKSSVPQHWDGLTTDTLGSNDWFLGLTRLHNRNDLWMCWKSGALVGTARKSLRWESIATQSIAGVVQIEHLLRQSRSQVPKRFLLSPIHSWLIQDQKLVTSGFYKSFLKRNMLGWPHLTCFDQTGSAKWQEGVATM